MLTPMQLFPSWFPSDALLIGVIVAVILLLLQINERFSWVLERVDPVTPTIVAIGAVVISGSANLAGAIGGSSTLWAVSGAVIVVVGMWRMA